MVQPLSRTVWGFLKNLNTELPYDPTIPVLGIYLEKTIILKDTCTPIFSIALFTAKETQKVQERNVPTDTGCKIRHFRDLCANVHQLTSVKASSGMASEHTHLPAANI